MDLKSYQQFAKKNWMPGCDETVFALGLGGECGEVLEVIKKAKRACRPVPLQDLKEELGDVIWYIANLCTTYGLSLQEVVDENVAKLTKRYPDTVGYRKNGPHIEEYDLNTGKHIKFCSIKEIEAKRMKQDKAPWEE